MGQSLHSLDVSMPLDRAREVLLSQMRDASSSATLVAALSGLIVLRWADQQEAPQEGMAALDPASFSAALVPGSRWRDWCELSGTPLHLALAERVLPAREVEEDAH